MKILVTLAFLVAFLPQVVWAVSPEQSLRMRRIEVALQIKGADSWKYQDIIASMLRNKLVALGAAQVAITGDQFRNAAQTIDRVHESGRYSEISQKQIPDGQWQAPTDRWEVTVTVDITRKSWDAQLTVSRKTVRATNYTTTAQVSMAAEAIDLLTGLNGPGANVYAEANKTIQTSISGSGLIGVLGGVLGGSAQSTEGADAEVFRKAYSRGLDDLVSKVVIPPLAPQQLEVLGAVSVPTPTSPTSKVGITGQVQLTLPSGNPTNIKIPTAKILGVCDQIWFVRAGTVVGKFAVKAITGQTAKLELILGNEPSNGDGFAIVYPK